jgi:hypothetical protein
VIPQQMLLAAILGWLEREQRDVIAFLRARRIARSTQLTASSSRRAGRIVVELGCADCQPSVSAAQRLTMQRTVSLWPRTARRSLPKRNDDIGRTQGPRRADRVSQRGRARSLNAQNRASDNFLQD